MPKIKFISDDEKELAKAFVKLVRVGKVSCLPNNTYSISDDLYSYMMLNHNEFPSFSTFDGESETAVLFGKLKIKRNALAQKPKTGQQLIRTFIEYDSVMGYTTRRIQKPKTGQQLTETIKDRRTYARGYATRKRQEAKTGQKLIKTINDRRTYARGYAKGKRQKPKTDKK